MFPAIVIVGPVTTAGMNIQVIATGILGVTVGPACFMGGCIQPRPVIVNNLKWLARLSKGMPKGLLQPRCRGTKARIDFDRTFHIGAVGIQRVPLLVGMELP